MGLFDFLKRRDDATEGTDAAAAREQTAQRHRFETLRDDGVRAMRMGAADYAAKCFAAALEMQPEDLRTTGYMAECLCGMQEYAAARPYLERLAAAEPRNVEVRLLLARSLGRTADFPAMRTACDALMADFPDEPRAVRLAAEAARGLGDALSAVALLTRALAADEEDTAARLLRARVLADMGQWNEVLADTERLNAGGAAGEDALLLHGDALAATGRTDEAQAVFVRLLENNPFDRDATLRLGGLHEAAGTYDRALAVYDEAIALQPDFAEAYKRRGGVRLALHDEAGAADDLKRALELQPEAAKSIDGEFSSLQDQVNARYRAMNPYGF